MESNWAAEHLQVIRTLMERSAIYRRALAPVMIYNGVLGIAGGVMGSLLKISAPQAFVGYWAAVGVVALAGSFLLVRRQARALWKELRCGRTLKNASGMTSTRWKAAAHRATGLVPTAGAAICVQAKRRQDAAASFRCPEQGSRLRPAAP